MKKAELHIDTLILEKSFHELTTSEKLTIKEVASTEAEFNETKIMLIAIQKQINSIPEIEPNPSTKNELITEFNKFRPAKAETNSGLAIFFPQGKPIYKKLGVQIIAAAAVLALIFTLFIPNDGNLIEDSNNGLAMNEDSSQHKEEVKESILENKDIETKDNSILTEDAIDEISVEASNSNSIDKNNQKTNNTFYAIDAEKSKGNKPIQDEVTTGTISTNSGFMVNNNIDNDMALANDYQDENNEGEIVDLKISKESLKKEDSNDGVKSMNSVTVSDMTIDTDDISQTVTTSPSVSAGNYSAAAEKTKDAVSKPILISSKSLSDNKELIRHFYTAM